MNDSGDIRSSERSFVRRMFDRISPRYDLLNRLMSAGQDMRWRRKAIRLLGNLTGKTVLDLCCGTGDFIHLLGRQYGKTVQVCGIDFSEHMLRRAGTRLAGDHSPTMVLCQGDALQIPLRDESVEAVTIGFGIRNIVDKTRAFEEIRRVLKPRAKLIIIEPTLPGNLALRAGFTIYFRYIMPFIGGLISGDREAYKYLHDTVADFPCPDDFTLTIQQSGFVNVRCLLQALSTAAIYYGEREG